MKKLNTTIRNTFHSSDARDRDLKQGTGNKEKNESLKPPTASETLLLLKTLEKRQLTTAMPSATNFDTNSKISLNQELEKLKVTLEKQNIEISRVKSQLAETIEKFNSLYDTAISGYFTLDKAGIILDLNNCGSVLLGSEKEKIRNGNFIRFVSPASREIYGLFLSNVFETSLKQSCELQLVSDNTGFLNVQVEGIVQPGNQNCILSVAVRKGSGSNDTDSHLSNERFKSIIENVQDVYYETELDGTIIEISRSVEIISEGHYKREDLIGKSINSVYYQPAHRDRLVALIMQLGSIIDYEIDFRNKEGKSIACSISAKIVFNGLNGGAKIVGTIRDIRTRKKTEKALAEQNRDLNFINKFALNLSHLLPDESVEDFLIQQIKEYTGATLITYSQYNDQRKVLIVKKIESDKGVIRKIVKVAGKGILKLESPVDSVAYQRFFTDVIVVSNSFKEITFGAIPEAVNITFKAITRIERIIGITLAIGNELLGAMMLGFRLGMTTPSEEMLHSFAHLAAVALRRKKAEDDLKASNELLEKKVLERTQELEKLSRENKAIVENAGLSIISVSTDGIVQTFNPAAERMLGYSANEVIGKMAPIDFHNLEELSTHARELSGITGKKINPDFGVISALDSVMPNTILEWKYRHKNGGYFPVKLTISSFDDAFGNIAGYIGIAMDITREKMAMEALRESESRFYSMFHNHSAVMLLINPATGYITEANKAAVDFYGYNFYGSEKYLFSDFNVLESDLVTSNMFEACNSGNNCFIFKHKLASGEIRTVEVHSSQIEILNSKLLFSIIHDITERSRAEELLMRSEAENRAILAAVPDLLFRISKDGTFQASHSANLKKLYAEPEKFLGQKVMDVFPEPLASNAMDMIKKAFESRETETLEYQLRLGQENRYFENRILAISNDEVLSVVRDITSQKIAAEQLALAMKKLTILIQNIRAGTLFEDETRHITLVNETFCSLFNIQATPEQLVGVDCAVASEGSKVMMLDPEGFSGRIADILLAGEVVINDELLLTDGRIFERDYIPIRQADTLLGHLWQYRDVTSRVKARKALQWNESLLKKVTESSPLAFLVVDNRTDEILYVNHQFCEIWGITQLEEKIRNKELKNNDIIPRCLPVLNDIPAFALSCAPLQDENNRVVLEDEIPFADGRTIRRFTTQIRDEIGNYHGRLYIFEDITQRNNTEQFLIIQRDLAITLSACSKQEDALQIALDAVLQIKGVDGGGIWLYNATTEAFELDVHRGMSHVFIKLANVLSAKLPLAQLVLNGQPIYGPFNAVVQGYFPQFTSPDYLSLAIIPIHYEGKVIGAFNLASKTTPELFQNAHVSVETLALQVGSAISRIFAEKAMVDSQQNFRTLFETIADFMFILDLNGNIMLTNPVVEKRLGYEADELYKMNVLQVHPPERREEAGFIVGEMLAGRKAFCPVPLYTRDGNYIPVETQVILGKWDGQEVLYGISRDITERQKAEQELQLRESYLSSVINQHPGLFWMKDLQGRFLMSNHRNNEYLRFLLPPDVETAIGLTDFDYMTEMEAERYRKEDQQIIDTMMPIVQELLQEANNQLLWYEKRKFPVVNKQGEVIGVSGYAIEIGERKKAEAALKRQSAAFEAFALAIIITDLAGHIQWANSSFTRLTGYEMDEVIGKIPCELIKSGVQSQEFYQDLFHTIRSGKVWSGEIINRRKNGSTYPEEQTISPVLDANGEVSGYIAIKIDISSRREMEQALKESEARWNFALEGSGDGVWDWNLLNNDLFVSRQWKIMFGYSDAEIGSKVDEWEKRVHPDDIAPCYEELNKHFSGDKEIYLSEYRILCKDGTYKWVLDRGKVVEFTPEGKPSRVIGTVSDITERKNFEQSLRESIEREKELNELKSKFISVASHEFRTPLATIMASSDSLQAYWEKMTGEQREMRFTKIQDQVAHLNKYIEDMLNLSKLQSKAKSIEPVNFDMAELVSGLVDEFRNIPDFQHRLHLLSDNDPLNVFLDKKEIRKMFSNLISNALKYSPSETKVIVKLRTANNAVEFTVKDEGIGIPEHDLKHVFEAFFRASNTANIIGTGLGLNIVKESVERHNGTISAKSELNKGSEFMVRLPLVITIRE